MIKGWELVSDSLGAWQQAVREGDVNTAAVQVDNPASLTVGEDDAPAEGVVSVPVDQAGCRTGRSNGYPQPARWRCKFPPSAYLDTEVFDVIVDCLREGASRPLKLAVVFSGLQWF